MAIDNFLPQFIILVLTQIAQCNDCRKITQSAYRFSEACFSACCQLGFFRQNEA